MRALLIFFVFIYSFFSLASDKLNFSVVKDEDRSLTIKTADSLLNNSLNFNQTNFGFYAGTIWIKINTINADEQLLTIKNANLDRVVLYSNQTVIKDFGDQTQDLLNKRKHRYFSHTLTKNKSYVLRIDNYGDQLFLPFVLSKTNTQENTVAKENILYGIYFGFTAFILILNILFYVRLRAIINLYYSFYIFGIILLQLGLTGVGTEYIWSNSHYLANHILPFSASLSVLFLLLFVNHFIKVKELSPFYHKILKLLKYALIVILALSVIPNSFCYKSSIILVNVITFILNLITIPLAIKYLRKGSINAKIFLSAFTILIISVFLFILRNVGVLPNNFITEFSLQIGSLIEVTLLTLVIINQFNDYRNEALRRLTELNEVKSKQNEILEIQIAKRTKKIQTQKVDLEHKNKEILDSINYAKRIQTGLMPKKESFKDLFTDSFILHQPKDIVSGDYFWFNKITPEINSETKELSIFCIADCTGHGVPGSILSVLGIKILNESLNALKVKTPEEILYFLNSEFQKTFLQYNSENIADGMDIALCIFNESDNTLLFSGANNGLLHVSENGNANYYKGSRNPIGGNQEKTYTTEKIEILEGDCIYLYSDGYPDQFGGEKGKKFKSKHFKQLLIENRNATMLEQLKIITNKLNDWKEGYEQTDDISVLGVKF